MLDAQTTEIMGTHLLVSTDPRDGFDVALPQRDRGIDLIAYLDPEQASGHFVARPLREATLRTRLCAIVPQ